MIITSVSYRNLKGRTEDIKLGPATLIHGPNFAGKTTIVDAIKLALLGFMPGLDRTNAGVMELASGDELSVGAVLKATRPPERSESVIGHTWTRTRGKIGRKDFVPMDWPDVPVVLLDAGAYFGASDRGKAELLFNAARIETSITVLEINKALVAFGAMISQPIGGETTQAFVERALAVVEKSRSESEASVRRYADTMQGLSALRSKEPVPVDEDAIAKRDKKANELLQAERDLTESQRIQSINYRTATPGGVKLDEARRREKTIAAFISEKGVEIGKCIARWDALLKNEDCPMCGTKDAFWRKAAHVNKDEELKELEGEKLALTRERNSVLDFINAETPVQNAEKEKQKKADKRKIDKAEEKVAELREELAACDRKVAEWVNDAADRKRLADAKLQWSSHTEIAKNMKEAKAYLLQLKEQMATQLFQPIIKTASTFTDGLLRFPLAFNDGELGYWLADATHDRGDYTKWVPHRTFSGTEQAVAFAAFQAALGATAPVRLVIMDELGRIDEVNKTVLLVNVAMAIQRGLIDQCILIDTEVPIAIRKGKLEGFTLIERGGKKEK